MTADAKRLRVLLVDDHPLVRAGIKRVLELHAQADVVGEAGDGEAAMRLIDETPADVLVLDLNLPGPDGFAVLAASRKLRPAMHVLILTLNASAEAVGRAVRAGAEGYVLKDAAATDLVAALEALAEGRAWYGAHAQRALAGVVRSEVADPLAPLTAREREVLRAIAEGLTSKEIAERLFLSVRTVDSHRASLMRKLDERSVARLTRLAIQAGLLEPREGDPEAR